MVETPWPVSKLCLHRSIVQIPDGDLLAFGYGCRKGSSKVTFCYCIASKDEGRTWQWRGLVAEDGSPSDQGYNEPGAVVLADGSLLCLMRTTHKTPLMQSRSKDCGRTWSTPVAVADHGVAPQVIRLKDGTLLAVTGRPGVFLMVDFSGSGAHWQKVPYYEGGGSSYASLIEMPSGEVQLYYDESNFVWGPKHDLPLSCIMQARLRVTRTPVKTEPSE